MAIERQDSVVQSALDALRESEERFRTLAECAPVVVWMVDPENRCTYISPHWYEVTGRDPLSDLGFGWIEALHPDDRQRAADDLIGAAAIKQPCRGDYRVRRASGEYGWLSDYGVPYFRADGSFAGYIGTCIDITEHKERQSASTKAHSNLLAVQEAERTRIARELHDDIGQRMALLSVALDQLLRSLPEGDAPLVERVRAVRVEVESIAGDVHRISHDLHPAAIAHLGLIPALQKLCRTFQDQMRIVVQFTAGDFTRPLPERTAIALFRMTQECLGNVARHSDSLAASVSIAQEDDAVRLRVADQGMGFDVARLNSGEGLGLISVRERVAALGGTVEIRSAPMQGTTVDLRVPLRD